MNAAEQSKWRQRRAVLWPCLLAATITVCSGLPAAVPQGLPFLEVDKLGHFAAYGTLATAIFRHPTLIRRAWLGALVALLLASAYGLGDEFRQTLTHGIRQYDLADWAADTLGAAVAVALYAGWPWYRRWLETPLRFPRAKASTVNRVAEARTGGPVV